MARQHRTGDGQFGQGTVAGGMQVALEPNALDHVRGAI
jgi:hypothetical protein